MKLWLLDADVIIDLLSLSLFDKLIRNHKVFAGSTVIGEVKSFKRSNERQSIDLRQNYIENGFIKELSASAEEIKKVLSKLPKNNRDAIHAGELESLAILVREDNLNFCSCDATAIRTLPLLGLSDRGISVEKLLKLSGLTQSSLKERHTEKYFKNNLAIGQQEKTYYFSRNGS